MVLSPSKKLLAQAKLKIKLKKFEEAQNFVEEAIENAESEEEVTEILEIADMISNEQSSVQKGPEQNNQNPGLTSDQVLKLINEHVPQVQMSDSNPNNVDEMLVMPFPAFLEDVIKMNPIGTPAWSK